MLTFFKKELVSNPFFVDNKPVQFEVNTSTNQGVLKFDDTKDDPTLIAALKIAISERRGGIVLIDEQEYEAIKKNTTGRLSAAFSPPEKLRAMQPLAPKRKAGVVVEDERENTSQFSSGDPFPGEAPPLVPAKPFIPAAGKAPVKESKEPVKT